MTNGQLQIWIAVYAVSWVAETERQRKYADADVESGKVARAVRAASEATRALREACARGTVPDVELVREVLDGGVPGESGYRPHPHDPRCRGCGAYLIVYSDLMRGDRLCGPCHRATTDTQTPAERELEVQTGGTPQPPTARAGRYLVQDAHNPDREASEITASSAGAAARIYAERETRDPDVPDRSYDYIVKDPEGCMFWVRLDAHLQPLDVHVGRRWAPLWPASAEPPASSTPAASTPSRRGLERVRRANGRRRRAVAAKGSP